MNKLLDAILSRLTPDRLREPSTYAGLGGILALIGLPTEDLQTLYDLVALFVPAEYAKPISNIMMSAASILLILRRGRNAPDNRLNSPNWVFLIALSLMLPACGAVPWNKQNYAGISYWKVRNCDMTTNTCVEGDFTDGKESEEKQLAIQLPSNILIKYSTSGEASFDAFRTRADVERYVAEQFGTVSKEVVDAFAKKAGIKP